MGTRWSCTATTRPRRSGSRGVRDPPRARGQLLRLMGADRCSNMSDYGPGCSPPGWTVSAGTEPRCRATVSSAGRPQDDRPGEPLDRAQPGARHRRGFLTEPWWCRTLVLSAERTARRGAIVGWPSRRSDCANPVRQAMLDVVDLALMHGCAPAVYRWGSDRPASSAAWLDQRARAGPGSRRRDSAVDRDDRPVHVGSRAAARKTAIPAMSSS